MARRLLKSDRPHSLAFHQSGYCSTALCLLESWYHRFWQSWLQHPAHTHTIKNHFHDWPSIVKQSRFNIQHNPLKVLSPISLIHIQVIFHVKYTSTDKYIWAIFNFYWNSNLYSSHMKSILPTQFANMTIDIYWTITCIVSFYYSNISKNHLHRNRFYIIKRDVNEILTL